MHICIYIYIYISIVNANCQQAGWVPDRQACRSPLMRITSQRAWFQNELRPVVGTPSRP